MSRITLTHAELVQKLHLSIKLAGIKRPAITRQVFDPRTSPAAERNRGDAEYQLAEYLADAFRTSKHEVTRHAVNEDGEAILANLQGRERDNLA